MLINHFQLNFQARGILNNDLQAALENFHAFVFPRHSVKHSLTKVLKDYILVSQFKVYSKDSQVLQASHFLATCLHTTGKYQAILHQQNNQMSKRPLLESSCTEQMPVHQNIAFFQQFSVIYHVKTHGNIKPLLLIMLSTIC